MPVTCGVAFGQVKTAGTEAATKVKNTWAALYVGHLSDMLDKLKLRSFL